MSTPTRITAETMDLDALAAHQGRIAIFVDKFSQTQPKLDAAARRVNRLCKGGVARLVADGSFAKAKAGEVEGLAFPSGMAAQAVEVVALSRRATGAEARRAGANLARRRGKAAVLMLLGAHPRAAEVALGFALRDYDFTACKGRETSEPEPAGAVRLMVAKPDSVNTALEQGQAVVGGVHFTRDLVNTPANILTTTEFANRLCTLEDLGLKVQVLEEPDLEKLGMGALLAVGQGSASPSKVVMMQWMGAGEDRPPLALVGKGVVFDTGGISLKPAAGMEDMTTDMGGAGVVAGVMRCLALRKARANVIGAVGLVENMPSGQAVRPGDVVRSMKGDTVEILNTDAEGRLVLCDVLHHVQKAYKPTAVINLATLTGAIVIALGAENAGAFSNDDTLCNDFLQAAQAEGEGAWRMPLGKGYAAQLRSRIADVKNIGGRGAGSITAAEFLHRFIAEGMPWIHLDIAGVTLAKTSSDLAPKGATGWGVRALNRLVADRFEQG